MRKLKLAPLAGVVAMSMAPHWAQAAQTLSLSFTGSGSFAETVFPYEGVPDTRSFSGPVTLDLSIADSLTAPYVDTFSIQWAPPGSAGPYRTGWEGQGLAPGADPFLIGFLSTVVLTDAGGTIHITPSAGYISNFDGDFTLDLTYVLSGPHPVGSSFIDNGVTGSGAVDFATNFEIDPTIGPFDAEGGGEFTVSSLAASAPEPATWALLLIGFFSLGSALRVQRGRVRAAA